MQGLVQPCWPHWPWTRTKSLVWYHSTWALSPSPCHSSPAIFPHSHAPVQCKTPAHRYHCTFYFSFQWSGNHKNRKSNEKNWKRKKPRCSRETVQSGKNWKNIYEDHLKLMHINVNWTSSTATAQNRHYTSFSRISRWRNYWCLFHSSSAATLATKNIPPQRIGNARMRKHKSRWL